MTEHDDMEHETPDLVGLLAGELSRDETVVAAQHLHECAKCAHELADLVVAHAALRSSSRVSRLLNEHAETPVEHHEVMSDSPLPPLAPLQAAPETGSDPRAERHSGVVRGRRARLLGVAAVLVLVVAGFAIADSLGSSRSGPTPIASAPLHPIGASSGASGSVSVFAEGTTRSLSVETHRLPDPAPQRFYEVWLLDPAIKRCCPWGSCPHRATATTPSRPASCRAMRRWM